MKPTEPAMASWALAEGATSIEPHAYRARCGVQVVKVIELGPVAEDVPEALPVECHH